MNKRNYQKELEKTLVRIKEGAEGDGARPSLFLHSCCAPCSSYVLEYLSQYFSITVFYYNPNISPEEEYEERVSEQERLIRELNEEWSGDQSRTPVRFLSGPYEPERFYQAVKGLEKEPEGGLRCTECFSLRLEEAARMAAEGGYDFFTTTLSISPLKDAERLNRIGEERVVPCTENGGQSSKLLFYGSSFMTDETGEILAAAPRDQEKILYADYIFAEIRNLRREWGLFRDRRPETYSPITR